MITDSKEGEVAQVYFQTLDVELMLPCAQDKPSMGGLYYSKKSGVFVLYLSYGGRDTSKLTLFFIQNPDEYYEVLELSVARFKEHVENA